MMDRRQFVSHAIFGLGLAAVPSLLRAQASPASTPAPTPAPTPPVVPPPAPMPPAAVPGLVVTTPSFKPLFDRAKAALDQHGSSVALRDRVALADFSVASSEHRFHIVDVAGGHAISYLVAHGRGSDPGFSGFLQSFSNEPNSAATSEGAYVTGPVYSGIHGVSMRLVGLDPTNSNADIRAIVVHGASYVSEDHIAQWGKAGRSEGCFAVAPHLIEQVMGLLGSGRLLYAAKV